MEQQIKRKRISHQPRRKRRTEARHTVHILVNINTINIHDLHVFCTADDDNGSEAGDGSGSEAGDGGGSEAGDLGEEEVSELQEEVAELGEGVEVGGAEGGEGEPDAESDDDQPEDGRQ